MNILKDKLENFFRIHKREINIRKLISILKISKSDYQLLIDTIYELEKDGKIIGNSNGDYIHKPDEFYLYQGVIQKSSKNHFYLNLHKGVIITIPNKNLNGAKENDIVYVSIKKGEKHNKQKIGNVERVVIPPNIQDKRTFYKVNLKKNYVKNFYYVKIENDIIYIPDSEISGAYHNDLVTVQVVDHKYGKVIDILKRNSTKHVFEFKEINGIKCFVPIGTPNFKFELNIKNVDEFKIGDRILVDLSLDNKATYLSKIENSNDFNSYVKALFYDFGFSCEFSEKSKEEAKKISGKITEDDQNEREDLRHLETFTIDGKTAKDLDDAISFEFKDNKYYLYVHIADVSHFVKFGSSLFEEAYKRGTSVYPANIVFPMLMETLSNGVCSLNPNEDKLTKTCKMIFDLEGNIIDFSVVNSIIRSDYKMTYDKVNDMLLGKETDEAYKPYVETLKRMNDLSNLLQIQRVKRGCLFFENDSKCFDINENDNIENMYNYLRGPAELIIENFMLKTNELITTLAYYYKLPFIYRNHEGPTPDQINKLKDKLSGFKNIIKLINNIINPKVLQKIILSICKNKTSLESLYFSKLILKCMNRATYSVENIGHYALALDYYGTFTSPIRRFPDLLNHIMIDKIIKGDLKDLDTYYEKYKEMCQHCNEMQLAAEKFERHVDDILLRKFISNYVGKTLDAKIEFISHQVICIKTNEDLYGYIQLPKRNFVDNKFVINGMTYETGDKIKVTLDGIKQDSDELLFSIKEKQKVLSKKRKKERK